MLSYYTQVILLDFALADFSLRFLIVYKVGIARPERVIMARAVYIVVGFAESEMKAQIIAIMRHRPIRKL